jgi:hypothetical protein
MRRLLLVFAFSCGCSSPGPGTSGGEGEGEGEGELPTGCELGVIGEGEGEGEGEPSEFGPCGDNGGEGEGEECPPEQMQPLGLELVQVEDGGVRIERVGELPPHLPGPFSYCAGDFDGDGAIDLAVAYNTDLVVAFDAARAPLPVTFAGFFPPNPCPVRDATFWFAAADLDADGDDDLLAATIGGMRTYEATAAGDFVERANVPSPFRPPVIGDLTGDGLPDLVVGALEIDMYRMTAGLLPVRERLLCTIEDPGTQELSAVGLADVTSDGMLDVVATGSSGDGTNDGEIYVFPWEGDGLGARVISVVGPSFLTGLAFMDGDGDGVGDVYAGSAGGGLVVARGDGASRFEDGQVLGDCCAEPLFADLDGDGVFDVADRGALHLTAPTGALGESLPIDGGPGFPRSVVANVDADPAFEVLRILNPSCR